MFTLEPLILFSSVFPGDASEEQRNQSSGAASAHKRPATRKGLDGAQATEDSGAYVVEAVSYLMRMCLMALGGYYHHLQSNCISANGPDAASQHTLSSPSRWQLNGAQTKGTMQSSSARTDKVTFPLPSVLRPKEGDTREKPAPFGSPVLGGASSSSATTSSNSAQRGRAQQEREDSAIEVRRLVLPRAEEVEAVWAETCKALADLVSSPVPNVSFHASYSLEVLL